MRRIHHLWVLVASLVAMTLVNGQQSGLGQEAGCGPKCGEERWPVKTPTDDDASKVNFRPVSETVGDLVALKAPESNSETSRLNAAEKTTLKVWARLVGLKHETDQDFHIVIADLHHATKTMIVEIPDPECGGVCASPKLSAIQKTRRNFAAQLPSAPPATGFKVVRGNVEVEVTGVGFLDFAHGQTGLAQNCIELHPVLAFDLLTQGPFKAKHDPRAKPPKHPMRWYSCIPEGPHDGHPQADSSNKGPRGGEAMASDRGRQTRSRKVWKG